MPSAAGSYQQLSWPSLSSPAPAALLPMSPYQISWLCYPHSLGFLFDILMYSNWKPNLCWNNIFVFHCFPSCHPAFLTHIIIFVFLLTNTFICVIVILSGGTYMKSYSSREVIKMLKADGWYEVNVVGSHHQYKHPTKKGRTTIKHPDRDIPLPTLKRIEEQSGLKFR